MPRKFKLDAVEYALLTYPTVPVDFDPHGIIAAATNVGAVYRLGRELHADGKPHFHCYLQWAEPYTDDDAGATFTVAGRRPNIKRFSANPGRRWDYVGKFAGQKEGHYIVGDQCDRPGGDSEGSERSSLDIWSEIMSVGTKEEFFDKLAALAPRQLGCNFGSLKLYAEWKYDREAAPAAYASPEGNWSVPWVLQEWADKWISGDWRGRYVCPPPWGPHGPTGDLPGGPERARPSRTRFPSVSRSSLTRNL